MIGRPPIPVWNYKAAVLSSVTRSLVFFGANLPAGLAAAQGALMAEFCLRFVTSGFYGAATQAFRRIEPPVRGTLAAIVVLPVVAHGLEFAVHSLRGTPELAVSMGASVALTVWSTAFNLFAMRRGVLVVGEGSGSLAQDLCRLPRLVASFLGACAR